MCVKMIEKEKTIWKNPDLWGSTNEVVVQQDEKLPEDFDFEKFFNSIKINWWSYTDVYRNQVLKERIRKTINENPKMYQILKDSYIISIENDTDTHALNSWYWVNIAADILNDDKNAKIILASFLKLEMLDKEKQVIFENPNVYYMSLPELDFNSVKFDKVNDEAYFKTMKVMLLEFVRNARHKACHNKERFYKDDNKEIANNLYKTFIKKFGEMFPAYSYDEFAEFCVNWHIDIDEYSKEKMPWQEISWVYCDIDGTLIITWEDWELKVNNKVLDFLKNLEELWKEIHIRTWGNLSEQRQVLERFWIKYPLSSKYDYSWASAEFVIDDIENGDKFYAFTTITPKTYINVNEIK